MSWNSIAAVTSDAVVVVSGLMIATPFFLVLAAPFVAGI
jgi:hypothetical protein